MKPATILSVCLEKQPIELFQHPLSLATAPILGQPPRMAKALLQQLQYQLPDDHSVFL